jgi:homoserine dehydrogenase
MTNRMPFVLIGLGNIGRNLLDILVRRGKAVRDRYGIAFELIGAADSSGAIVDTAGIDMAALRDLKASGGAVAALPGALPGLDPRELVRATQADLLVDASPTNLTDGEPGLTCTRLALGQGWHVVAANKGPLVLAYDELTSLAAKQGKNLLFSGTVAGGLPTVNIGVRDLAGSGVLKVEGIFNGTTNYILSRMLEEQIPYEEALRGAQEAGIAEADPTLDVDGFDAANKLVIIANSVLDRPTTLFDVAIEGIRKVSLEQLVHAREQGRVIKPLAVAERQGEDYALRVGPVSLPERHPLARTGMWDMAVVYTTDYMGTISAVIEEKGPVPTSAAVLRDMIHACE